MKKLISLLFVMAMFFSMSGVRGYAMITGNSTEMNEGLSVEITEEQLQQLHSYRSENVPVTDEEIDEYLVKNGYNTQKEIDRINLNIMSNGPELSRAKYINGYNKYRTFERDGKTYLYLYLSGTTLRKIYYGADLMGVIAGILPQNLATVIAQALSYAITSTIEECGTKYGIVLCHVKDRWVHPAATYTYRYYNWFYQT